MANKKSLSELSIELMQHELGSINLDDIDQLEKQELADDEFLARASEAEMFYKNHFEKVLKLFIQKQLEWIGTQTQNTEQLMFGRGIINGLFLIQDWFEEQSSALAQHREDNKPQQPIYGQV